MRHFRPEYRTLCCPNCGEVEAHLMTFTDRLDHELEWQEYVCPECDHEFEDTYNNNTEE